MKFKNAPLIELVAEFRWIPSGGAVAAAAVQNAGQLSTVPLADPTRNEAFFSRFTSAIGKYGYVKTERLLPAGWPYPGHIPVVRFRRPGATDRDEPTLYQIGAGIFSAHALPPYDNWQQFKPVIRQGLDVLLNSRPEDEREAKFGTITLRYIDRFTGNLIGNVPPREFIERVLNIRLQLPAVLTNETPDEAAINPSILLKVPLKSGLLMNLGINSANDPAGSGILMDTSVVTQISTNCISESAMGVLEIAHDSIRRVFIGLTLPIAAEMEPEQDHVAF